MQNAKTHRSITRKMEIVYAEIKEIFSPISLILDEQLVNIQGLAVIKPKLKYSPEKMAYAFALRTIYGGSGVGIDQYDSNYAVYFYIDNSYVKGGIYNILANKRVTDIVTIEKSNDTDDEYINALRSKVFNRIRSFLLQ